MAPPDFPRTQTSGSHLAVRPLAYAALAVICCCVFSSELAQAQRIRMKDGRLLEGRIASTSGVADHPDLPTGQAGGVRTKLILIVDDSLRRTFVSKFQVAEIVDAATDPLVKITVWQNADLSGRAIASVGPSLGRHTVRRIRPAGLSHADPRRPRSTWSRGSPS